jgi:hypothetical protein
VGLRFEPDEPDLPVEPDAPRDDDPVVVVDLDDED